MLDITTFVLPTTVAVTGISWFILPVVEVLAVLDLSAFHLLLVVTLEVSVDPLSGLSGQSD